MKKDEIMDFGDADHLGECLICGKHRAEIAAGKLRPCYEWQRVADPEAKDEEEA